MRTGIRSASCTLVKSELTVASPGHNGADRECARRQGCARSPQARLRGTGRSVPHTRKCGQCGERTRRPPVMVVSKRPSIATRDWPPAGRRPPHASGSAPRGKRDARSDRVSTIWSDGCHGESVGHVRIRIDSKPSTCGHRNVSIHGQECATVQLRLEIEAPPLDHRLPRAKRRAGVDGREQARPIVEGVNHHGHVARGGECEDFDQFGDAALFGYGA
jgi:hypothetical protein